MGTRSIPNFDSDRALWPFMALSWIGCTGTFVALGCLFAEALAWATLGTLGAMAAWTLHPSRAESKGPTAPDAAPLWDAEVDRSARPPA